MKTSIVTPRNCKPDTKKNTFPALYKNSSGDIVFASDKFSGVIIHVGSAAWPLGFSLFGDNTSWDDTSSWTRVTEPITIKFQP
jgi:hypothetical protein